MPKVKWFPETHDAILKKLREQTPRLTNGEIARRMGFSHMTITQKVRLLNIPARKTGKMPGQISITDRDRKIMLDYLNGERDPIILSRRYQRTTHRINQILKHLRDNGKI